MASQVDLFGQTYAEYTKPRGSLLKWIGSKYRVAEQIAAYFPHRLGTFYDVFVGSAALLATVAPERGCGSDTFRPLIDIWQTLVAEPETLKAWYAERWRLATDGDKKERYEQIKASYNADPNGADFLFLTRSCYGGVVRFRKADGYMSTPCGPHRPISPESFDKRVDDWHGRIAHCDFVLADYTEMMRRSEKGDLVYCDPPYSHSQAILYGAQDFSLERLLDEIARCKSRGARVALSIDGTKRSGDHVCDLPIPQGLFEREVSIEVGRSMLKRFQMDGRSLEDHVVTDRLMLTY